MSKPVIGNARWDTDGTNMTAPSSGQRDTGIVASAAAVSSYINYLFNQIYLWFTFLDGLIGSTGSYTAGVDQHVTVSGTGFFKHGNRTLIIPAAAALANLWTTNDYAGNADRLIAESASTVIDFPIMLPVGARIRSVSVNIGAAGTGAKRVSLWHSTATPGAPTDVTSGTAATSTSSGAQNMTVSSIDHVMIDDAAYCVSFEAGDTGDHVVFCKVIYDQP